MRTIARWLVSILFLLPLIAPSVSSPARDKTRPQEASGHLSTSSALTLYLPLVRRVYCSDCYYVDSANGSDTNPGNSRNQAWRTIQKAADTMPEGSTVIVLEGNYPEAVSIRRSSLTFIAQGQVITKGFYITGNTNRVKGFVTTNPDSDWGIRVDGNGNIIEENNIHHTKQDGIWFFGSNNIFRGNYIHDIIQRPDDPHIDCFQTWGPAYDILFEQNICHNPNTYGSNQILMLDSINPPVRDITFRNNIFIMDDPGYSPMNFQRKDGQAPISNITVVNNTIVHPNGIGYFGISFDNVTGAIVKNNLFIDYGDQYNSYVRISGNSTNIVISNNAVYKTDGIAPQGGPYPGDIWMLDPRVENYNGLDLHLTSSSPLIDRGYNVGSLVVDDFDGNPRPQGRGYDIGAYEHPLGAIYYTWLPFMDPKYSAWLLIEQTAWRHNPEELMYPGRL